MLSPPDVADDTDQRARVTTAVSALTQISLAVELLDRAVRDLQRMRFGIEPAVVAAQASRDRAALARELVQLVIARIP